MCILVIEILEAFTSNCFINNWSQKVNFAKKNETFNNLDESTSFDKNSVQNSPRIKQYNNAIRSDA